MYNFSVTDNVFRFFLKAFIYIKIIISENLFPYNLEEAFVLFNVKCIIWGGNYITSCSLYFFFLNER